METWMLDIIEVKDPWNFLVRRIIDDDFPDDFTQMEVAMAKHLDMAIEHGQPAVKPVIGEVCAAQKRDGTWHRVRVESVDTTEHGRKMKCYLVDKGIHQTINPNRLHKLPSRFQAFPSQAYECRLWGVHPLMLAFDETDSGLGVQHMPSNKWDVASVKYMNRRVEGSSGCKADIIRKGLDDSLHIRMYLCINSDWLCINDELVDQNFASHSNEDPSFEENSGFASQTTDCSTTHSSKTDYSDMPSLSLVSESDSDMTNKTRQFVQNNLKRSLLLSPTKVSKIDKDIADLNAAKIHRTQNRSSNVSSGEPKFHAKDACNEPPALLSRLQTDDTRPTQARGRASLNQILTSLRPGGLSSSTSSSCPKSTSPIKSALASVGQPSNKNSNADRPTVSFSPDNGKPHLGNISIKDISLSPSSPPQSSSTPLSFSSTLASSNQERDNKRVARVTPNESDSSVSRVDEEYGMIPHEGTGARPKVRFSSPPFEHSQKGRGDGIIENISSASSAMKEPQPRHRKNLASELVSTSDGGDDSFSPDKESLVGKMEGQRLLQRLRQKSGMSLVDREAAQLQTNRPDKPQMFPNLGTFVYGKGIPLGVYTVMDYPFVSGVKKVLNKVCEKELAHGIEAYMWPSILAGRNVVGVSHGKMECDMAYIPPLLSLIADRKDYAVLPHKMGPLVLVVVPSWRRARKVYELVETFTGGSMYENKQTRTIALYAGGVEECSKTEVALIRGCEILISTTGSLLRTVTGGVTSLKRVCHLVLDNADVLASRFQEEISNIMQMYSVVVKERKEATVPHQVMVFSKRWTEGVDAFRLRFTKQPILSFSSRLEASIYGEVKQIVVMCKFQQRLSKLADLIDSLSNSGERVITWTSDVGEAKELAKTINSRGVYCLLTHHEIDSDSHIEEIRQRWMQSAHSSSKLVVLVATDQCYQDLAITDATTVIHYELPQSKTRFGNRLSCMSQHFSDRLSGFKSDTEAVSHVILTERNCAQAQSFLDVLKRCNAERYQSLEQFIQGYVTGMQTNEGTIFCPFIKSFGFCLDQDRCENRHVLVPERDLKTGETTNDTLPVDGEVKLKVIHVVNANHFYCRLLEHRSPENSRESLREEFNALTMELALFFSKESNHVPYSPPQCYQGNTLCVKSDEVALCGFKTDDGVHRARVVDLREGTRADPMKMCRVWLVDSGCHKVGTIDQLVKLSQRLAEVPYQAVEVFVCRLKPIDKEAEWTDRADIFVNEMVNDKVLIGRIVLRLGMSMWLDPLVHQVVLKKVGPTNDMVIRQEILANNYASPNPEHIQLLCELCRGKVDIPEVVMQRYYDYCLEMELTQESLPSGNELHKVYIANISHGLFYIQRLENADEMEELEARICEEMDRSDRDGCQEPGKKLDASVCLGVGGVGLAKSDDGKWYRVKIISKTSEDHWEVFSLDYGDREVVPLDAVRPLPREYAKLPCQAIECEMANLAPLGSEWSPETVDILCDLSYYASKLKKELSVKVQGAVEQSYSLAQRLVVDVYDHGAIDNQGQQLWFAEQLVWRHAASWTGGDDKDTVKPILDKPFFTGQKFFYPLDKVRYLCAKIYWEQDISEACQMARELNDLLSSRKERWDTILTERNLFPDLVQIIGYVPEPKAHGIVLDSLVTCCLDSDKLCEEAVNRDLPLSLSLCLEQISRPEIQLQAAQAVARLLTRSCFMDAAAHLECIFMDLLQLHSQNPLDWMLLDCCCRVICTYIRDDKHGSFIESQADELFTQIMGCLSDEDTREDLKKPWLQLLATLAGADYVGVTRKLLKESTIKLLLQLLQTLKSSACLSHLVLTLQSLVDTSRRNKVVLLEAGLQPIVRQVSSTLNSSPELVLCMNLLSSLTLQFPAQEGLAGRRIEEENTAYAVSVPPVAWTETCFKVQLKVKVKNADVDDFEISPNNLKCRALSDGTLFQLDWDLYSNVIPGKSRVEPYSSYTIISLRKETEGKWGRLLKQKNKPANLSPDFDYLCDSEKEEDDDDDNNPGLTKKRKGIFENLEKINAVRLYSSEDNSDELAMLSYSDDDDPKIDYDRVLQSCIAHTKALPHT